MTADEFNELRLMLDTLMQKRNDMKLSSLHAGGMIMFSRKVRDCLTQWEIEVARRAKAEAIRSKQTEECTRRDFGEDAYDTLDPDHAHGLDFGNQ